MLWDMLGVIGANVQAFHIGRPTRDDPHSQSPCLQMVPSLEILGAGLWQMTSRRAVGIRSSA